MPGWAPYQGSNHHGWATRINRARYTAYYSAMTYAGLGLRVAVVTKLHTCDHFLIFTAMENDNIHIFAGASAATTTFDNIYPNSDMKKRLQKVSAIADTLQPQNLDSIDAAIYHLGPLTAAELAPERLPVAANRGQLTALDVQGLIRQQEASFESGNGQAVSPEL